MIRPITSPTRHRNIITYDMEWYPGTLELRLIGVYDGAEYRSYLTPIEFLRGELTTENSGAWFFAHAGGLADFQFLLSELVQKGYVVKAAFSGSSAIIVEITDENRKWLLIDSYWLLRSPLKKIGEAVGIKKLKDYVCPGTNWVSAPDGSGKIIDCAGCDHPPPDDLSDPICIFYAPMAELRTYNEFDNRILHKAICDLQEGLLAMGSELCMTQASSAMKLYRRVYLDRDIKTNKQVNERARVSYVGSRVEVFAPRCTEADYYDINSSFPYAMTFPAPGSLRGGRGTLPTGESEMWLADVEIEVPDMYLPPIPWRHPKEHRVYFPTGKWRTWLWGIDVRLLESVGGRVLKCHRALEFSSHDTLAAYAQDLYAKRVACKTEFEKMLYKLLLNSLYGKFGESPLKQAAYINPENMEGMNMVMPGVFLCEEIQDIEHEHVPISTHITAFARRTLYRFNKLCLDLGGKIYYNDSVSGDRCLVVKDPQGRVRVMPVERLWDEHARWSEERFDGKEEAELEGWTALSKSLETGKEGFFPIRAIIRHRANKTMHMVTTKDGQTEITSDHGIMVEHDGELVEATADEFVENKSSFVRVTPPLHAAQTKIDLYDELSEVVYDHRSGHKHSFRPFEDELHCPPFDGTVKRFYTAGSGDFRALLRTIAAYVSEGSACLSGTLGVRAPAARTLLSISQKKREWLEKLEHDFQIVLPDTTFGLIPTSGVWTLRSGATTSTLLYAALCGQGSDQKRLPTFCMNLGREDFLVLWETLLEGDGHAHWEGYSVYTSISLELVSQLSYLLSAHGIDHAVSYRPSKKAWSLRTRTGKARPARRTLHETRESRPGEYVYDLSVDGGGTFVDALGCVLLKNTDSCTTTITPEQLPSDYPWVPGVEGVLGKRLGQMKHEYHIKNGQFVAPKIYHLNAINIEKRDEYVNKGLSLKEANDKALKDVIRAKGFSRMNMEKFHALVEGREIEVRRMTRVRELFRSGTLEPAESPIKKRLQIVKGNDGELRFKLRSKRKMLWAENDSRPWAISELYDGDPMAQTVT